MKLEKNIYGKVTGINKSDSKLNIACDDLNSITNIKCSLDHKDKIQIGIIYCFKVSYDPNANRASADLIEYKKLEECDIDFLLMDEIFRKFYPFAKETAKELEKTLLSYINKIDNKTIKDIISNAFNKYKKHFMVFPAATRFHHAYVGGIASHTCGMLKLADSFIPIYDFVDKDYLYAGVIMHDLAKTLELTGIQNTEYSLEGNLIGHLVLGSQIIFEVAKELNYENKEEVKLLQHLVLSHHGQLNFGSPKKPMTAEALLLWHIDSIDSKFSVLGEELNKVKVGEFTDNIAILERGRFLRHK